MREALESLLFGVIDYAGLFPPARLAMPAAFSEFQAHLDNEDESWILDRFVCPAAQLPDLAALAKNTEIEFGVTVIGTGGATPQEFDQAVSNDLARIESFERGFDGRISADAYEVKATDDLAATLKSLQAAKHLQRFVEIPLGEGLEDRLHMIASHDDMAAKARTGGLSAEAFPDSASLARFFRECCSLEIAYKVTAGLHHPIRRLDAGLGCKMHGFVNVFMANALLFEHDLGTLEIEQILEEEQAEAFVFTDESAAWRELSVGLEAIEDMRDAFGSFGSCSIREPLDDLKALNWLSEVVR